MANPRANVRYTGVQNKTMAVQLDSSINLPTISNGNNLGISTDQGAAVAWTSTTTYSGSGAPTGAVQVGKGSNGDPVAGQLVRVDPDGFGSIINQGIIEVLANSVNSPLVNGSVAVDGSGKVIASTNQKNSNAKCIGYAVSVNQNIFVHATGTISPPTGNSQSGGPEVCLVLLS